MRAPLLLLIATGVVAAACSPLPTQPPSAVVTTPGFSDPTPQATSVGVGTLVVTQSRIVGGFYTEGAFAYVEVTDEDGTPVALAEDPDYHLAKELVRVELPAGRYVVRTYVRPCEAACPALDGPSDGCEMAVDMVSAGSVEVRVDRRPGMPCEASLVDS